MQQNNDSNNENRGAHGDSSNCYSRYVLCRTVRLVKREAPLQDPSGSKRRARHVLLSFLELNGIHIEAADEDVVSLGLGVADGSMEQKEILEWINKLKVI